MLPKILVIVGPTASGKTDLGIHLAKVFNGEVIAVDSRTVYRGMDIGTAKPKGERFLPLSEGELEGVRGIWKLGDAPLIVDGIPHWGIDLIDPDQDYSVADFKKYAEEKIADVLGRGKLPILVGGTGLWIDAVVDNLSLPEVPADPTLRAELDARSTESLFVEFESLDPIGALEIDRFNKRRLIRALEVTLKSGKPFSAMKSVGPAKYNAVKMGIEIDREELRARIDERVDRMIANGLVDEVRKLKDQFGVDIPPMTAIGYRQICFFLDKNAPARGGSAFGGNLNAAIDDIKTDTWHYAKRQLTWFKHDQRIRWFSVPEVSRQEYFSWCQDQLNLPSLSSPTQ